MQWAGETVTLSTPCDRVNNKHTEAFNTSFPTAVSDEIDPLKHQYDATKEDPYILFIR
jgi:hypothetical protein